MNAICASCHDPLEVVIDSSDEDEDIEMGAEGSSNAALPRTVPDDVHMRCGCHFHWQCLLDAYSVNSCPSCSSELVTETPNGQQQVLCSLHNEGGIQKGLDILPLLTEEGYLRAYPEERKARAFLEFCKNGDVPAIVEMLQDEEEDAEDNEADEDLFMQEGPPIDILRYQDPIGEKYSGLHAAVAGKSLEVAWLLLLLASELDLKRFPAVVFQEAANLKVMREDTAGKADIRSFRDAQGRTAEDLASEIGGLWTDWLGKGLLAV